MRGATGVSEGPAGTRAQQPWAAGRKLLFLVTEDWYFCSHRLPVARAARDAGFQVLVATRVDRHGERIRSEGFRLVELPWRRRSRNLLRELSTLRLLWRLYRREAPDIVHHVALKPALYGAIVGPRGLRAVSTVAGLGYLFTSTTLRARLLRPAIRMALKRMCRRPGARAIVQNPDDRAALTAAGIVGDDRVAVIRGSGVDVERFTPTDEPEGTVTATMVARMLWSKGVREMVTAARLLSERGADVRVVLVGEPDDENPESVPVEQLRAWARQGLIEWRGHQDDMPGVLRATHIAVLPTYREGLPMTLLEAAASGRAIVATDVPGCREIVRDGENGLLVPCRDAGALAAAIATLAADPERRRRMGACGREMVAAFAQEVVAADTLALYRSMLEGTGGTRG
ncbi:MAG: glycosyltransferase family 4 protein [Candidatus Krumholzibacteria bacterium]|nr:glycosyltransferase family 4 protein [Candidatus Krumholzibacteria bacterium]